jgi:hypothetical protein
MHTWFLCINQVCIFFCYTPVNRIDTNQDIFGSEEVSDGADERYAPIFKSRIPGINPCNAEMIFKIIKLKFEKF